MKLLHGRIVAPYFGVTFRRPTFTVLVWLEWPLGIHMGRIYLPTV